VLTRRQFVPTLSAPLWARRRRPNIVLVVSDDHHWQCLGAAGNPHIQTPNLDRLAGRGVLFKPDVADVCDTVRHRAGIPSADRYGPAGRR
jgi:hypothetical protein